MIPVKYIPCLKSVLILAYYYIWYYFFYSFRIQLEAKVRKDKEREDLRKVKESETRILLLYATKPEGENIMKYAKEAGLTSKSYIWVATQSVIGEADRSGERMASTDLPAGMLGTYNHCICFHR